MEDILISSVNKEFVEAMAARPSLYSNAVPRTGDGYIVIDPAKVNEPPADQDIQRPRLQIKNSEVTSQALSGLSSATGGSDDGGIDMFIDQNSNTSYPKATCIRAFIPYTRFGYGIINWQMANPRIAHTLKDENSGSNSPSSLRCPRRSGPSTDYYVDGIYNILWVNPVKALKIPNHCTVTRVSAGFYCCCNAAAATLYGRCGFINPRDPSLPNWPDSPRVCTNSEL
jgi:hypothetical protein